MAFTYDDSLSTDRAKVRFYLQDTVSGSGPKPSSGNFTDNEVDGLVTAEGKWQRAVAAGLETLAASWRRYADITVGPRKESLSQIAEGYASDAEEWRDRHGYSGTGTTGAVWLTRVDGYSDDLSAGDVD